MASTGIINGTDLLIKVDTKVIARLTSNDFNLERETKDVTTKTSAGWRDILVYKKSFSFSANGFYEEKTGSTYKFFEDLYDACIAGTAVTVKVGSTVTGDVYYSGTAYIKSIKQGAPVEDTVTYTVSFEGTGALTKGTN
jgi:TP901-1 family phage major tail protein